MARRTSTAVVEPLAVEHQVWSCRSYNALRSDPMFVFNAM
jgi:hypothetical protein